MPCLVTLLPANTFGIATMRGKLRILRRP
jgi:hypothetical protein